MGGDEFLLILPKIKNRESLQIIKEKILNRFEQEFCISGHQIRASLSIGCALFPEDGEDIDSLLIKADQQMYLEKAKLTP